LKRLIVVVATEGVDEETVTGAVDPVLVIFVMLPREPVV
jgi:hypothetical protein